MGCRFRDRRALCCVFRAASDAALWMLRNIACCVERLREDRPMSIRPAITDDIPRMVELSRQKREQYQTYSPVFWRMADGGDEAQAGWFHKLVADKDVIALVHEQGGAVDGFVIGLCRDAPPVYDPGGKVCSVDDFCVERPDLWATVGQALLDECGRVARRRGCVLQVIVCGQKDLDKAHMLGDAGAEVASEWYVRPIADGL